MIRIIAAILYFIVVNYFLGYSLFSLFKLKNPEKDHFYSTLAYLAVGLSTLTFLIPVLNEIGRASCRERV